MDKIYKYKLTLGNKQCVMLDKWATVLHVDTVDDDIFLWARVNPLNKQEERIIRVFATGEEMPNIKMHYIGTVKQLNGKYIWHVFTEL